MQAIQSVRLLLCFPFKLLLFETKCTQKLFCSYKWYDKFVTSKWCSKIIPLQESSYEKPNTDLLPAADIPFVLLPVDNRFISIRIVQATYHEIQSRNWIFLQRVAF